MTPEAPTICALAVAMSDERKARLDDVLPLDARSVIAYIDRVAVGYRLPVIDLLPTDDEARVVGHLGPDLLGPDWDASAATERLLRDPGREIGDALLDPSGSSALTQATGELFSNDEPRNQLAVYAEGVVLSAPTVQQPIYGGALVIAGGLTNDEAQALLDRLTSA